MFRGNQTALDILYVRTLPPHQGGSALSGALLLIELARLGHRVRALAPITADTLRTGDAFAARYPEISLTRFVMPFFETSPGTPAPGQYRLREGREIRTGLRRLLAEGQPDLIFIGRETFAWHVPQICRAYGIPCLQRLAGGTSFGMLTGKHPRAVVLRLLHQFRAADLIVCPARHLARSMAVLGVGDVKVIPNGVDLEQFAPRPKSRVLMREMQIRDGDTVVLHVSNLKAIKRPLDLVWAADEALRENPRLTFVVLGDGVCRAAMEEACGRRRVGHRFRFPGWVDYDRVPDYLNLADAVVMTSEFEGQARVYLETQACARLLIASNIDAAREVVVDGETGLLFATGDVADLTTKIMLAVRNPSLREHIGRTSRERVRSHAIRTIAMAYARSMRQLRDGARAARPQENFLRRIRRSSR